MPLIRAGLGVQLTEEGTTLGREGFFVVFRAIPRHLLQNRAAFVHGWEIIEYQVPEQFLYIAQHRPDIFVANIDPMVLRGPLLDLRGMDTLRHARVDRIIYFGSRTTTLKAIEATAHRAGLRFITIPLNKFSSGTQAIDLMAENLIANAFYELPARHFPYFTSNDDRRKTGKMMAVMRVKQGMPVEQALELEDLEENVRNQIIAYAQTLPPPQNTGQFVPPVPITVNAPPPPAN